MLPVTKRERLKVGVRRSREPADDKNLKINKEKKRKKLSSLNFQIAFKLFLHS